MILPTKTIWHWIEKHVDWTTRTADTVWGNPTLWVGWYPRGLVFEVERNRRELVAKYQWISP